MAVSAEYPENLMRRISPPTGALDSRSCCGLVNHMVK
jgi:hypothetical protein